MLLAEVRPQSVALTCQRIKIIEND